MKHSVVIDRTCNCRTTAPLMGRYSEIIPQAGDMGFDMVQLSVRDPAEEPITELKTVLGQTGMTVSSVATGMCYSIDHLGIGSADNWARHGAVSRMKAQIDLCAELGGTSCIIGAIRGRAVDCGNMAVHMEALRRSCSEIIGYAESRNVPVLFEANDHFEVDCLLSVAETAAFIRSFNSKYFRLQLDTYHMYNENQPIRRSISDNRDILGQVDISDINRCAPDGQHYDFTGFMRTLKASGYDGYLVYEFKANPSSAVAGDALRYIKSLI